MSRDTGDWKRLREAYRKQQQRQQKPSPKCDSFRHVSDLIDNLVCAADILCEEIRATGTHETWKQLAHALDALEESRR